MKRKEVLRLLCACMLGGLVTYTAYNMGTFKLSDLRKLNSFASFIEANYYEDVDTEDLKIGAYSGLFSGLDRYSEYMSVSEYSEMLRSHENEEFCGVGIGYSQSRYTEAFTVVYVYPDSPAEKAGIKEGDVIDSVDDVYLYDMDIEQVSEKVRGVAGTEVKLGVYRDDELLEFTLERAPVQAEFAVSEMLNSDTGYIKIREFNQNTVDSFEKAMDVTSGCKNLIIDLRSNPGGDLDSLVAIMEQLVPSCRLCTLSSKLEGDSEITITGVDMPYELVVLVNSSSASCSEIFASAVQDNNFGKIIGQKTFGKGVWQALVPLPDGDAVKLTLGEYLTSSGRSIDEIGVVPDISVGVMEDALDVALDYFK